MPDLYDQKYRREPFYWGIEPSRLCLRILEHKPPDQPYAVLDIGCGEGRNAVFLASKGYSVAAFDLSPYGINKSQSLAARYGVEIEVFTADIMRYRLDRDIDIVLCANSLYMVPGPVRPEILEHYKRHTRDGGLHACSVIVDKPFIQRPPHECAPAFPWISGELLTYYHDWKIEFFREDILESCDGGVPHHHAVNALIARKPLRQQL